MKLTVKEQLMLAMASDKLKQAQHLQDEAEQLMEKAMARTWENKLKDVEKVSQNGEHEQNTTTNGENQ